MGLHRRTKVEQLRERDLMMPQEVRQMSGDKMVILAEGQGPIFADKLRFFRTAPFREMERFSQAHLPDVPATEFLPPRPVPATTPTYAGEDANIVKSEEQGAQAQDKATRAGRELSASAEPAAVSDRRQTRAVAPAKAQLQAGAAKATLGPLDARFAKAARKLKALAKAPARSGNQRGKQGSWARVFDETVPDELEIAEAEAS